MIFGDLVKKISPTLKRITYKLNGHFSFFNDEDLYQEALLRLWLDFKDGKLEDKTESYILQGCYFHLKNYIRKARNKVNLVSLDMLANDGEYKLEEVLPLQTKTPPLEALRREMLCERFQKINLSDREREVLSLCADGFTVREIGKQLGVSHVMVVKLKKKIQEKSEELKEELKEGYQK